MPRQIPRNVPIPALIASCFASSVLRANEFHFPRPPDDVIPTVEYAFLGVPETLRGMPGEVIPVEVFLTWRILTGVDESYIQGWGQSVVGVWPHFFSSYSHAENPESPSKTGLVGALLNPAYNHAYRFFPTERNPVLRLLLEVEIPPRGVEKVVELRYRDGMKGPGQPVTNRLSHDGDVSICPEVVNASFIATSRQAELERGDTNEDGRRDVSDAIVVLGYLFRGTVETECEDAFDTNDDGKLELTDAITLFDDLFRGGPPPAPPLGGCGLDETGDSLRCRTHSSCPS